MMSIPRRRKWMAVQSLESQSSRQKLARNSTKQIQAVVKMLSDKSFLRCLQLQAGKPFCEKQAYQLQTRCLKAVRKFEQPQ